MFPDRSLPDQYEQTVREIFPEFKSGSFSYYPESIVGYGRPSTSSNGILTTQSGRICGNARYHALSGQQGVEILRLDAVAFMWKRLGTDCENQPEAHYILQALRALSRDRRPWSSAKSGGDCATATA